MSNTALLTVSNNPAVAAKSLKEWWRIRDLNPGHKDYDFAISFDKSTPLDSVPYSFTVFDINGLQPNGLTKSALCEVRDAAKA